VRRRRRTVVLQDIGAMSAALAARGRLSPNQTEKTKKKKKKTHVSVSKKEIEDR